MKKRMLCLFLILVLSMALCTSAYAVETQGIMDTEDPVTGEWRTTQIQIKNSQGQWEWVDVYDGQGAPVWVETCNDQGELEWVPAGEAPGDGALQQRLKEKKAGLEQRFGVKIRGVEESRTPAVGLFWLYNLEKAMAVIPAPLHQAVLGKLAAQGRTLTISLSRGDPNSMEMGSYTAKTNTISLHSIDEVTFAHEYGHMLHIALLERAYGKEALRARWTALNQGAGYEGQTDKWTFLDSYSATSYYEDVADSAGYWLSGGESIQDLAMEAPDCPAIRKVELLRQLLVETFSVREENFPAIQPSVPSPWAAAEVARYIELFPDGRLASTTRPVYAGYRSGATRRNFAYGAYDLAERVWRTRYGQEEGSCWLMRYPEYTYDKVNALNPFTDLTYNGWDANEPIIQLYLMGVLSGTSPTTFGPEQQITRQEAAVMLCRLCAALDHPLPEAETVAFRDEDRFAGWARESIRAVCAAGIMGDTGDGAFDPTAVYSYEQSAITMVRLWDFFLKSGV